MSRPVWTLAAALACARADDARRGTTPATTTPAAADDTAQVAITRPTVIAYFLIPPGAVDTMPDLAVEADDWNVAMATLRDSLEANRIDLTISLNPFVQIDSAQPPGVVLALGAPLTAGYVFVRPGEAPCVRPGGMDQGELLPLARAFFARPVAPGDSSSARCTMAALPDANR